METPASARRATRDDHRIAAYALIARLFDEAFQIPGTRLRFGLDAIIGLIPGAGDVVSALFGTYGVWLARRLGAPPSVQARMMLNLAVDALFGAVPILGDLFDFAFKAHVRNRVLLENWLAQPRAVRRGSSLVVLGAAVLLLLMVVGAIWLAVAVVSWLVGTLSG